jgi:peptidoglycan/xylan/chitin deacetylase (PgdA/CDA1 family)
MGPAGFRRELAAAQQTLAAITGRPPRFFRPPAGVRSPLLDPVLHSLGLQLVTWTRRGFDTRRRNPDHVARRLQDGLGAGDILLLHDGNAARTDHGRPVVLEVLPRLLDAVMRGQLKPIALHAIARP